MGDHGAAAGGRARRRLGHFTQPHADPAVRPRADAGAAGGALQTAQRIGAAIGTAVLATIFYQELAHTGRDYPIAVSDTLLCASGLMVLALLMTLAEVTRGRSHRPNDAVPGPATRTHDLHQT